MNVVQYKNDKEELRDRKNNAFLRFSIADIDEKL